MIIRLNTRLPLDEKIKNVFMSKICPICNNSSAQKVPWGINLPYNEQFFPKLIKKMRQLGLKENQYQTYCFYVCNTHSKVDDKLIEIFENKL